MVEIGMAWFAQREDGWEAESERAMAAQGIPCERLDPADRREAVPEPRHRRPRVRALRARGRRGARAARGPGARRAGGRARRAAGRAAARRRTATRRCSRTARGSRATPSCGPAARGSGGCSASSCRCSVTRQELLFFDGGPAWRSPGVPGWVDYDRAMYGTGDLDDLGVKVALDKEGPPLDPDAELPAAGATEPGVRAYLAERFPALADAPLKEGRCCRYELSPDSNFFAARHPELERTWVVGGGSGPRLQARPRARRARSRRRCAAASRSRRASASATARRAARSGPPARASPLARARPRTTGRRARSRRRRARPRGPRP